MTVSGPDHQSRSLYRRVSLCFERFYACSGPDRKLDKLTPRLLQVVEIVTLGLLKSSVLQARPSAGLSLLHFVQAASRLGVDGFYTCTQGGETNRIADRALFNRTIKSYDMFLYKEVAQLVRYNIMHICDYDGPYEDFALRFQDYPGQVVNVPLMADNTPLSLRRAADLFRRPVMGGLNRLGILSTGSPEDAKKATLEALKDAPANVILGADCTVSPKTPMENLRMAIKTAHEYRV